MRAPRLQDWPARLVAFIESRRSTPFAWGVHDCCLFAADATLAMTGIDPAAALRGYHTAIGAVRTVRRCSGLSPVSRRLSPDPYGVLAMPVRCGFREIPVSHASRGDLVAFDQAGAAAIGVCLGTQSAGASKPTGIVFVQTLSALAAWRF